MLLFNFSKISKMPNKLFVCKLSDSDNERWLEQAAQWANEKWGYIRNFPGIQFYKNKIKALEKNFYMVIYKNQGDQDPLPDQHIGMFAIIEQDEEKGKIKQEPINKKSKSLHLDGVYVKEAFRGTGVGSLIVEIAKQKCQEINPNYVLTLDVLHPNLVGFYQRHGATEVCYSQFITKKLISSTPASRLRISKPKEEGAQAQEQVKNSCKI